MLGDPRRNGCLATEAVCRDKDLGRDEDMAPTHAHDQHPRPRTVARYAEVGACGDPELPGRAPLAAISSPRCPLTLTCASASHGWVSDAALSVASARSGSPAPLLTVFVFRCPNHGGDTAGTLNIAHHGFQFVDPSRSEHDGCASSGQQKGRRAADATARASNRDHFPVDACHIASSFEELRLWPVTAEGPRDDIPCTTPDQIGFQRAGQSARHESTRNAMNVAGTT